MDKLWYFAGSGRTYWVPMEGSIVDANGEPKDGLEEYELTLSGVEEFGTFCQRSDQIILVSGSDVFSEDYLESIPKDVSSVALIKADCLEDIQSQLESASLDSYMFSPFYDVAIDASLKKAYDDKCAMLAMHDELHNYSSLAFTAMSSASEMGIVAQYAEKVQNTMDFKKLANQTLKCLADLSVQGCVQFAFDDSVYVFPDDISKNYRDLLEWTRTSDHRIVSQGRFLLFNFENCQLLITDAPLDNPEKVGRLRDVVAQIVSIAESRAKTVKVNALLRAYQDNTRVVMSLLEMASKDNRNSVKKIMTDLSMSLREMAMGMDLTLDQERALLSLSEKAMQSLDSLHEATDAVEMHFRSLLVQLDQAAKLLETDEVEQPSEEAGVELF